MLPGNFCIFFRKCKWTLNGHIFLHPYFNFSCIWLFCCFFARCSDSSISLHLLLPPLSLCPWVFLLPCGKHLAWHDKRSGLTLNQKSTLELSMKVTLAHTLVSIWEHTRFAHLCVCVWVTGALWDFERGHISVRWGDGNPQIITQHSHTVHHSHSFEDLRENVGREKA